MVQNNIGGFAGFVIHYSLFCISRVPMVWTRGAVSTRGNSGPS